MPEPLSEGRPTFTIRPPRYPRKIALEEAVNTSVFNASRTTPRAGHVGHGVRPDYGPDIERRLSDPGLQVESMDGAGVALGGRMVAGPPKSDAG